MTISRDEFAAVCMSLQVQGGIMSSVSAVPDSSARYTLCANQQPSNWNPDVHEGTQSNWQPGTTQIINVWKRLAVYIRSAIPLLTNSNVIVQCATALFSWLNELLSSCYSRCSTALSQTHRFVERSVKTVLLLTLVTSRVTVALPRCRELSGDWVLITVIPNALMCW